MVAESVIDGVLHPELRDRMILLRGKPIRRPQSPNLVPQRPPPVLPLLTRCRSQSDLTSSTVCMITGCRHDPWRRRPGAQQLGNFGGVALAL